MTLRDSEPVFGSSLTMATADHDLRVVAVLGTSFSGSTLLNLILGAHSQIYAGGEMIGLFLNRNKALSGSCTSCGLGCAYWNRDARNAAQKGNLYRLTARIFDKRIIVDSSKSIEWFKDTVHNGENVGVVPSYVLMVKHPIRYLASCIINIAGARPHTPYKNLLGRIRGAYNRKALLDQWLAELADFYENFFLNLPRDIGDAAFQVLHYERLVADPRCALSPLLKSFGLDYEPQLDDFYGADFHQIGGNNGAIYQTKRNWNGGDKDLPEFRRKFYEGNRALKIDNKYQNTLSSAEIEWLKSNSTLERLCERLGYNDPHMPFAI